MTMYLELDLEWGLTEGEVMRELVKIMPEIESRFTQRKKYDEYYFDNKDCYVTLTYELIEALVEGNFRIKIEWGHLIIY